MITDARVLRTGFVPREVEHRDAEVTHLTEILAPLTDGNPAETTLLVGPSGVGKTCLAKYTAEQLRQEVLDVEYQYVNCWQNFSEFRTLYSILEGLGKNVDIHRQSTPHDELYDRLRQYDGPPCVVILDEADQLEEKRLLYHLHELPQFSMLLTELVIEQRTSKTAEEYAHTTRTVAALERAADDGRGIQPGQGVAYVVVDDSKRSRERVQLADESDEYDAEFYVDELLRAAESVLSPLGWREEDIREYLADRTDASIAAFGE